jgi:hypothetical protein|tara:strand:- start:917 stop:1099 length:183 start_codon:yes stop_codon:yes gene_type:complete
MKKIVLGVMLMISSLTFAHDLTKEQERKIYDYIRLQLDLEQITIEEAQAMWKKHLKCCKK